MTRSLSFRSPLAIGIYTFATASTLALAATFANSASHQAAAGQATAVVEVEPTPIPGVVDPEPEPIEPPAPYAALVAAEKLTNDELAELPRPAINTILPEGLGTAGPDDLLPLTAIPLNQLTPAFNTPDDQAPVLALESWSNLVIEPIEARWTVVGQRPGLVRVMIPVGRGAVPSENPEAVNHQAVWVPESAVELEPEEHRIEVSISNRSLTLYDGDEVVASFHVGVGLAGVTDTPLGLCSVIARVRIQTGAESLLTNCQSEALDGFAGANWATVAVHEGRGFSLEEGGSVSNGCVRVPPAKFKAYLDDLRIGTPVIVVP